MKRICKLVAMTLVLIMLLLPCIPVTTFASEIIAGSIEYGITETIVRETVEVYFSQREQILSGNENNITAITPYVQNDERKHLSALNKADITRLSSEVIITSLHHWEDNYAEVSLNEVVSYGKGEEILQETVSHELYLMGEGSNWRVVEDGYYEKISGFKSCAYVDKSSSTSTLAAGDGSPLCILEIAKGEIGYQEVADNDSKYGDYFNITGEWCVMFIMWCAVHADIPESIICHDRGTGGQKAFFVDNDAFFYSISHGGNASPQPGDIYFEVGISHETGHVGIVESVSGNTVTYIEGNNSQGKVGRDTVSLTSEALVGFGRPAYVKDLHLVSSSWKSNGTYHWKTCENCGIVSSKASHTAASGWGADSTYHWNTCKTCKKAYNKVQHRILSGGIGVAKCTICGYEKNITATKIPDVDILLSE